MRPSGLFFMEVTMIEFDESEYLYFTDFSHRTLDFMCYLYGPEVRDMLLIPKAVEYVRLHSRTSEHAV